MKKRYQYILFCLLILIVYEVYLVVLYKYKDFQINSYLSYIIAENGKIEESIEQKKERLAYVKTNAFLDKIAKTSQNKKNPGEEVVVLVTDQEVEEYKRIDTNKQMIGGAKQEVSKTLGMTNSEKWIYYIFHIDTRND
ncbi:hypothetical protein GW819_00490 [Candidatus Gracilibacteria bacterium]|nr:hypothetical protein [Candidatus Gracilibacteria bacterium]